MKALASRDFANLICSGLVIEAFVSPGTERLQLYRYSEAHLLGLWKFKFWKFNLGLVCVHALCPS